MMKDKMFNELIKSTKEMDDIVLKGKTPSRRFDFSNLKDANAQPDSPVSISEMKGAIKIRHAKKSKA